MLKNKKIYIALLFLLICGAFAVKIINKREIPVLNYHEIDDDKHTALALSTYEFKAQMRYLKDNNYNAITLDQLLDYMQEGKPLPEKPVVITLDDGYEDNYTNAYPILKQYGLTATIFLISHYINWPNYLTWKEIDTMKDNDIVFEGHTYDHPNLSQIKDDNELKKQLLDSKIALQEHLGYQIKYLAYPCGDYNQHVISQVKKYGYRAAFTVNLGDDAANDNLYTLNRVPIFQMYRHTFFKFWLNLHFPYLMRMIQQARS
ncbi:polysaccharide deacetylase family protein [Pectinatus haikarae]|uniref:Peptidoglycan/xylan/chitin deacetylase (PgdA/CDA1 family) n=1 Tax=Pectinatus haikarae TaxID=349096 RepID=A0ABT9YBE4_9FIRM|nr:polysaccharide deacetylase family protein [Pectinatus haikarae]MDQ0205165.1 peptidoglycan/xylan/chitin deacetylase (PgdA/CDA1 family) [Pectinatus haikarae]